MKREKKWGEETPDVVDFFPAFHQSYSSRLLGEAASHNQKLSASINAINTTHANQTTERAATEKTARQGLDG